MTLSINNLDAPLGAEVRGIDVSRALTPAEVGKIEGAWHSRLVVVIRKST
jgi:alpha-ketoglutarate-dependent taurine dioxygenase